MTIEPGVQKGYINIAYHAGTRINADNTAITPYGLLQFERELTAPTSEINDALSRLRREELQDRARKRGRVDEGGYLVVAGCRPA